VVGMLLGQRQGSLIPVLEEVCPLGLFRYACCTLGTYTVF
jgi:hypothetical protein